MRGVTEGFFGGDGEQAGGGDDAEHDQRAGGEGCAFGAAVEPFDGGFSVGGHGVVRQEQSSSFLQKRSKKLFM
jgi:hypothetical protein